MKVQFDSKNDYLTIGLVGSAAAVIGLIAVVIYKKHTKILTDEEVLSIYTLLI